MRAAIIAAASCASVFWLQGCGGGGPPGPSGPAEPDPDFPLQGDWKLRPLIVKGHHFVNPKTDEVFMPKGIGFPNCGTHESDVAQWIAVLEHLRQLTPDVNTIRIYEPPDCAFSSSCFEPFMRRADDLGFYVLVPGTHTGTYGYIPTQPGSFDSSPQGAYEKGGVLGFGQTVISHFNYPNTLAIVIGNEVDQFDEFHPYFGVVKAYARDLRQYMTDCNNVDDSPTKGDMRHIPLMYGSSDAGGDYNVEPKADYLFCGEEQYRIDIFGLNIERWCDGIGGPTAYRTVNNWVKQKKYPGAFFYSEMGCDQHPWPDHARDWKQVDKFFSTWDGISGYAAYTMYGNPNFNMVSDNSPTSKVNQDGKNFFAMLNTSDTAPQLSMEEKVPECPSALPNTIQNTGSRDLLNYHQVTKYDTGEVGWGTSCPVPFAAKKKQSSSVFV